MSASRLLNVPAPFSCRAKFAALASRVWMLLSIGNQRCAAMLLSVFHICEHNKILDSVIVFNSVDMMNVFVRLQDSAVRLFPNIAMLAHVSFDIGVGMLWHMQNNIAVNRARTSAFPASMIFTTSAVGSMARQKWNWVALKITPRPQVEFGDGSSLAASALTKTIWDFFRARNDLRFRSLISPHAWGHVPFDESASGLTGTMVCARRDNTIAAAFAVPRIASIQFWPSHVNDYIERGGLLQW